MVCSCNLLNGLYISSCNLLNLYISSCNFLNGSVDISRLFWCFEVFLQKLTKKISLKVKKSVFLIKMSHTAKFLVLLSFCQHIELSLLSIQIEIIIVNLELIN